MRVLVTGASGFVGRHTVPALLARGHEVVAVARDEAKLRAETNLKGARIVAFDLHAGDVASLVADCDAIVHLAWHGLPNYKGSFHFEQNLPGDYRFLQTAVRAGVKHVLVTGTCLEYGLERSGPIPEDSASAPDVAYAIAKDALRRFLEVLRAERPFVLQWVRLFYMHGQGQNPRSLLSQLDRAIDEGKTTFDMSAGEQLRDYLPITDVADILARLVVRSDIDGTINCCSGRPVSVRSLVERHLAARGAKLSLNLGVYPYPDYEPLAFWGTSQKLSRLRSDDISQQPLE